MYKAIKPDNVIFKSQEFQKDKYKFNLILKNLPSPEVELYSDEESYIVCRGSKNGLLGFGQVMILINQKLEK